MVEKRDTDMKPGWQAHPLQQPGGVFTYVCEASDDVVQVEVAEGGMVLTLPPHLKNK